MYSQLRRLERLERAVKDLSMYLPDCICFPEKEQPTFESEVEAEIAASVKCPLHGARFKPQLQVFMAQWYRAKLYTVLWHRRSEQYQKAWIASFPEGRLPPELKKLLNEASPT